MRIARTTATQIMSRAISKPDQALLAILDRDHALHYCSDTTDMSVLEGQSKESVRICNQHPDAMTYAETHPLADGRYLIEVFQDTEGVFGLRAYRQDGKMQTPAVLEFEESA